MDLQLQGKKAIISGGSRGIGKATARLLALEGCDLALGARSAGPLHEAADELAKETGRRVVPIVCDTMNPQSVHDFVSKAAESLGGIDILINAAARVGGARGDIESVEVPEILRDFEEKVIGYIRVAREAVPYLKRSGWGRIVNISGGAGRNPGTAISGGVRNAGVVVMTKSLANALGPHGINVNAVYPGTTVTEATYEALVPQAASENTTVEALLAAQAQRTLLRHLVTAEEVANVIAFLCSPLAIGITGEAIAVNGGGSPDIHF